MSDDRQEEQASAMALRGWRTVKEAAERAKVSESAIYRAITANKLETKKIGSRIYVSDTSIESYTGGENLADIKDT